MTDNLVKLPPAVESEISQAARDTARWMHLVPGDGGRCQFEIHAGTAIVEIYISADGLITGVHYESS